MNRGWTCPNCGGCYSPTTPQCFNCTGRYSTSSGTELDAIRYLTQETVRPPVDVVSTLTIGDKVFTLEIDGEVKPQKDQDVHTNV